jgi:hypothetical protein
MPPLRPATSSSPVSASRPVVSVRGLKFASRWEIGWVLGLTERGFSECAEEDSNLHPVIPDQALNLVTWVSDMSYACIWSRASAFLDAMDALDDLDVATDVATDQIDGPFAAPAVGRRG